MLYASMLNITLDRVRLHIEGRWSVTGSVFRQTRRSIMDQVSVDFDIDSNADPTLIAAVLRNATNGCHAESALRDPTPVSETVRLNGDTFDVEAYPATTVQRA
jgi:hypothetical protein